MTEEDYQKNRRKVLSSKVHILNDIARQLTIANEIATMRGTNELRAQSGMAVAYTEQHFDTIIDGTAKPAPDALVEAVRVFLDDEICGGYEKPTWEKHSVRHLQDALADHEKAVR